MCCRLIGTPVAPFTGANVPATVKVFATPDGGTAWQRIYEFPGREPCVVESIKRLSREGTLIEALPACLRMALDVYARDGVLHFVSNAYYFELGRMRIGLLDWLPPGTTHVEHIDLGNGSFRFTMRVRHRWLGEVFYQTGCFRDPLLHQPVAEDRARLRSLEPAPDGVHRLQRRALTAAEESEPVRHVELEVRRTAANLQIRARRRSPSGKSRAAPCSPAAAARSAPRCAPPARCAS